MRVEVASSPNAVHYACIGREWARRKDVRNNTTNEKMSPGRVRVEWRGQTWRTSPTNEKHH